VFALLDISLLEVTAMFALPTPLTTLPLLPAFVQLDMTLFRVNADFVMSLLPNQSFLHQSFVGSIKKIGTVFAPV
jgi:hypothetical protein